MRFFLTAFLTVCIWFPGASAALAQTCPSGRIVCEGSNGELIYSDDGNGNRIADFSWSGYQNGNADIPETVPFIRNVARDASDLDRSYEIQAAIDEVCARTELDKRGMRGAVVLASGVHQVQNEIFLNCDGIVLRGSGNRGTTIRAVNQNDPDDVVIVMGGGGFSNWEQSNSVSTTITDALVEAGERVVTVQSVEDFVPGMNVMIYRPCNSAWLAAVRWGGPDNAGQATSDQNTCTNTSGDGVWTCENPNQPGIDKFSFYFNRYVMSINAQTNQIILDVPLFNDLNQAHGGAFTIREFPGTAIRRNIGVENLTITTGPPLSASGTSGLAEDLIVMRQLEDGWIRNITATNFRRAAVNSRNANRVTVEDVDALDPTVADSEGGLGYNFAVGGWTQQILFQNNLASEGRHNYIGNGAASTSGIVFYSNVSEQAFTTSEGHKHWIQGILFDNHIERLDQRTSIEPAIGLYNRYGFCADHGWSAVNSVVWNSSVGGEDIVVHRPPTAQNFAVGNGSSATGVGVTSPVTAGYIESGSGSAGSIPSLYLAQVDDRAVTLDLSVWLAGAYNTAANQMDNDLDDAGSLPLDQPFQNYGGRDRIFAPDSFAVVDWVLVSLLSTTDPDSYIEKRPGIVLENGQVVSPTGETLVFRSARRTDYYVRVEHRNHLDVISSSPVSFSSGQNSYDFRDGIGKALVAESVRQIEPGAFGLREGDMDGDGLITGRDALVWFSQYNAGTPMTGYLDGDLDLDNEVDTVDLLNIWLEYNGLAGTEVPLPQTVNLRVQKAPLKVVSESN